MKQNTEADPSSIMAENSYLISKMPERETGLPVAVTFINQTLAFLALAVAVKVSVLADLLAKPEYAAIPDVGLGEGERTSVQA